VVCTGRSSARGGLRSDYERPETIEETAELVTALGGTGVAIPVDHLDPQQVSELAERLRVEHGHVDVLVNNVWGAERLKGGPADWNTPIWQHDLDKGLRIVRLGVETHLITSHHLLPLVVDQPGGLLVEVTDGTAEYNATQYRISVFYDLVKVAVNRLAFSQGHELVPFGGTAVAITPGWLRSEMMLDNYGVSEHDWRNALQPDRARWAAHRTARFRLVGVASLRRPCCRRARSRRRPGAVEPAVRELRRAGPPLRLHRHRRSSAGQLVHGLSDQGTFAWNCTTMSEKATRPTSPSLPASTDTTSSLPVAFSVLASITSCHVRCGVVSNVWDRTALLLIWITTRAGISTGSTRNISTAGEPGFTAGKLRFGKWRSLSSSPGRLNDASLTTV
jgi:NAD(P)-dependent dehydrogenase (short-subunit alcohol dehydrogenase family)